MPIEIPWELSELRDNVRDFVKNELLSLEQQGVRPASISESQSKALQQKIKDMGLWLLDVPEEYGGAGLGLLARCLVYEEIAKSAVYPHRSMDLFGPRVGPILGNCNEEQKERFLYPLLREEILICFAQTEPDAGTDPGNMRTRAERHDDHYLLNGTKRYISGASKSDYAQVVCITNDDAEERHARFSVLIVDLKAPGVTIARSEPTMMGDAPDELVFDNVKVPIENRIGEEGEGFASAQAWLTQGRVARQAARCLGIAQRSLDMAIDYSRTRVTFGEPLNKRQGVQFMIADSAMELHAARLMVYDTAARFDRGEDIRNESYMTKVFAVEHAHKIVDRSIQIHGALGLTSELPLQYWYRQLRSLRITEGAHEVLRWRLGRSLSR